MFRRQRTLHLLFLAVSLALAACAPIPTIVPTSAPSPATPTAAPLTLTDGLGREVTLAAPPLKIVSVAASTTELLYALGAGDLLVGRDSYSDYPAEALNVASIGDTYPAINAEAVVDLEPDLVLVAGITNPDDIQRLQDLGLTVFATRFAVTIDDIYADITDVGTLTGHTAEAAALIADMQTRIAAVQTATANVDERPTVFYEIDGTDPAAPYTAGPGSFNDQLISLAGGANVGNLSTDPYPQLSLEQIVAEDPEIIVLGSFTFGGQTPEIVAARPGWGALRAVLNDKVYTFDDNLISRPGPRIVDGLEALAKLIHPELFQ